MHLSLKSYLAAGLGVGALGAFLLSQGFGTNQPLVDQLEPIGFVAEAEQMPELIELQAENEIVAAKSEISSHEPMGLDSELNSDSAQPNFEEESIALDSGDDLFGSNTTSPQEQISLDSSEATLQSEHSADMAYGNQLELADADQNLFEIGDQDGAEATVTFNEPTDHDSQSDHDATIPTKVDHSEPSFLQRVASTKKHASWKQNPFINADTPAPVKMDTASSEPLSDMSQSEMIAAENQNPSTQVDSAPVAPSIKTTNSVLAQRQGTILPGQFDSEISAAVERTMQANSGGVAPLQMGISDSAAQQAAHHIEYGKSLSRRGAAFAARQEFLAALKVVAEENDTRTGGSEFSRALQTAATNLKEAEDFISSNPVIALQVEQVVETHRSKIITVAESKRVNSREALNRYLDSAQQNFDMAGGRNIVAAEALYNLGKLHRLLSESDKTPRNSDLYRSIVFHKTALMGNPNHHQSANELGVMMARSGQLVEAKQFFKQSLQAKQNPMVWNNLAKAHTRAGEQEFASLAKNEALISNRTQVASNSAGIQWMSGNKFNSSGPVDFDTRVASNADQVQPIATQTKPSAEPTSGSKADDIKNKKSFTEKLKDLF